MTHENGEAEVEILQTSGYWFGVTYPEDKAVVVASIKKLVVLNRARYLAARALAPA